MCFLCVAKSKFGQDIIVSSSEGSGKKLLNLYALKYNWIPTERQLESEGALLEELSRTRIRSGRVVKITLSGLGYGLRTNSRILPPQ